MNQLHEAYSILGLKPGSSKETILKRWKRLAMVWHPDRLPTEEGKKEAEEELKKINNAKDLLWKHFENGAHKTSGCECQPGAASQQQEQNTGQQKTGPGPGPKRKTHPDPEEEAKRRDAERQRRAAEEAAGQQQQAQQQEARQASYQKAQQQEKSDNLRWKVAKAEAIIFAALSVFGFLGSSISAGIHSIAAENQRKADQTAADEAKKNDPCQAGESQTPPSFAQANIKDAAMQAVKLWRTNCKGTGQGAIVAGQDERGQLITALYFGPNLVYQAQFLVSYEAADKTAVELWNAPNELASRTIYTYDASHNLIEIRKLDSQLQPLIIGTIERRPGGGFFAVDLQFIGENRTTKLYQTEDPQLEKNFDLFGNFGKIAKQVDPAPSATSPDIAPAYKPTGDLTDRFKYRPTPFSTPFSTPGALTPLDNQPSSTTTDATPPQTNTGTDGHLSPSPFGGTDSTAMPSPGMDALLKSIDKQNSKPQ
ncbi:MAG: J domain-containing protein [Candidatus Obscuribacterales bacterium]|nr:J domain-containing protein [Candidatus Obscuribacterales bacterium]